MYLTLIRKWKKFTNKLQEVKSWKFISYYMRIGGCVIL